MHTRHTVRQALDILNANGLAHPFRDLPEDRIAEEADRIVQYAREMLEDDAGKIIDNLNRMGFGNKTISLDTGYDESTVSRAHRNPGELRMGLPNFQQLVADLNTYVPKARLKRFFQTVAEGSLPLQAHAFCASGTVSAEEKQQIARTVLKNIGHCLTGTTQYREALPGKTHGALLHLGPPDYGLRVYQSEGRNSIEKLRHEIHEVRDHLLPELEALLALMEEKDESEKRLAGHVRPESPY